MSQEIASNIAVHVLREVIVTLVKRQEPTLSAHQFSVFLTCYLGSGDHTVRGLAKELSVSKSVVTRALDKLGELGLASRRVDPLDARSVIVDHTPGGLALMENLREIAMSYQSQQQITG